MTGTGHQAINNLITDSGHWGISLNNCNYCKAKDNEIDRAGWAGININTSNALDTSLNNQVVTNLLQDDNVLANPSGSIENSSSAASGLTDGTLVEGNTVRFLVFGPAEACNGTTYLTIVDSGCKEGIQTTDGPYHTTYIGNRVYNSALEGIVCGGVGCVVTGNTCDTCGLSGGGGIMWSYGSTGTTPVGDAVYANNVITNSSSKTLLYCGSVESKNTASATYENIKFANNVCSGGLSTVSPAFTNGFRYVNTGSGTVTLNDVDFIGNTVSDKVTTPFNLSYAHTTNVVSLENNIPMPAPTYSSGFSTGAPTIFGGYPSFTVTIGTTPSSSGTLTMPITALTGWTIFCVDMTSPLTGGGYDIKETANTTTSVTVSGYSTAFMLAAWTAGDVLHCQAAPY
jgi:hypothetical protein